MTILAEDPSLSSTATVMVEIRDVQDQPPVFLDGPYRAVLAENSPPGTSVYTVRVRDGDIGQPRSLRLDLIDDPLGFFRLADFQSDTDDSILTATIVTSDTALDREADIVVAGSGIYSFRLRATELVDGLAQGDTTIQDVDIVVLDVDDQPPLFERETYTVQVPENIGKNLFQQLFIFNRKNEFLFTSNLNPNFQNINPVT